MASHITYLGYYPDISNHLLYQYPELQTQDIFFMFLFYGILRAAGDEGQNLPNTEAGNFYQITQNKQVLHA